MNLDTILELLKEINIILQKTSFLLSDRNRPNSDHLGFINNELSILGIPPLKNKVVDTVALARKVLNTRIANLFNFCAVSIPIKKKHWLAVSLLGQEKNDVLLLSMAKQIETAIKSII